MPAPVAMPAYYEIRVMGVIPPAALPTFESRTVGAEPVETHLRGPLPDQGALPALLTRLEELGVQVVEVRRLFSGHVI